MNQFEKWLRSKNGRTTIIGLVVLLLVVGVVGQLVGWWDIIGLPSTAGLPDGEWPAPPGDGYTCLPTCDVTDGRMISMVSDDLNSFGGEKVVIWIGVPGQYTSFELGIFDGDSGKDDNGNLVSFRGGNWDGTTAEATYTLYADPLKDGTGTTVVGTWHGNADNMPNNAWWTTTIDVSDAARAPSQHYFYRLEIDTPLTPKGLNRLKVRSNGYLITGQADLVNAGLSIVGGAHTLNDGSIIYPQFQGDWANLGPSTYSGEWNFYFYVPDNATQLDFWDGDFDRGQSRTSVDADTDDPNTEGKPEFAASNPNVMAEGVGGSGSGTGAPPDDYPSYILARSPGVWYELIDPAGNPIYTNNNPSGTEEWEHFVMSTDASVNPDQLVDEIKAGFYTVHIVGLDMTNTVWIRTNFEMVPACADGPCKPPPEWPEGTCPRTIGYWKNNVKKVLIENRDRGVQETRASLEWGLNNVALASPLFRSGLNVAAPAPIEAVVRLTDAEAHAILQKDAGNSMLDRALQQNLATWLNLGTGKIGPTTVIHLVMPSGNFDGTIWEALQTAQNIILYERDDPARLEYAKDIADMINNNSLNQDPGSELPCTDYESVIPPDKQPPAYEDMPKGPKPPDAPNPTPQPPADPNTCGARVNNYGVENPTNNPFYSIKFNYQSGTEIKNGEYEIFQYTLPADVVQGMTSIQMEAKAATDVGTVTLEGCDFTKPFPCGDPVTDGTGLFAFQFAGSTDNGDGTYTLNFWVYVFGNNGLSHASFGLPEGVVPASPTNTYDAVVCP